MISGSELPPLSAADRRPRASIPPPISIVTPTLDEADTIAETLRGVRTLFAAAELIVVDGGSVDDTIAKATPLADQVMRADCGRAAQMSAGARRASGAIIVFLHADTVMPEGAQTAIETAIHGRDAARSRPVWGRFDVEIEGRHPLLPVIAFFMNLRSRLTGVATGDQAIFVTRSALDAVCGVPQITLMEDIALSKALRRLSPPACLRERVKTSGRRWEANGAVRTILLMWALRLGYAIGVPPDRLARAYRRLRRG